MQGPPPGCDCKRGPLSCPVNAACETRGVVYQATVTRTDNNTQEMYTGLTSRRFKDRFYEHTGDFKHRDREGTSLSEHIWDLKDQNAPYNIKWEILAKKRSFDPSKMACDLCLKEKHLIMFKPEGATLNKRSEFYSTCRHRLKPLLSNS